MLALLAVPALYLVAALVGSIVPVNSSWVEAERGTTIYIASNGIHADIVMPVSAQGLDWRRDFPSADFGADPAGARWIAFGAGEKRVYLDTPRWRDLKPSTAWHALAGGDRVIHVEYVRERGVATREIRLRPEEYRRLWAAIRSEFELGPDGRPVHIRHAGYGPDDAFYRGRGKASAIRTCNSWTAGRLRLAGIRTSLWPPFLQGMMWRYRRAS